MIEQNIASDTVATSCEATSCLPLPSFEAATHPLPAPRPRTAVDIRRATHDVVLFAEGDAARHVFQVEEGCVMLYKLLPDGRRHILDIVGPGSIVGSTSGARYSCSAKSLTPTSIRVVPLKLVDTSPELQLRMRRQMLARIDALQAHAVRLGRMSAIERVASFLLQLADTCGGRPGRENDVPLLLTLGEMADHLGLVTETVCRNLMALKKSGAVAMVGKDRFRIVDRAALAGLALVPQPATPRG
jgi:CRP/FNR family transcriptional regulator